MSKIDVTNRKGNICFEWTGRAGRISTVTKALRKALASAGYDEDILSADADIKRNLDRLAEWNYTERDTDEDGRLIIFKYENLTSDINGRYCYGCISINTERYGKLT